MNKDTKLIVILGLFEAVLMTVLLLAAAPKKTVNYVKNSMGGSKKTISRLCGSELDYVTETYTVEKDRSSGSYVSSGDFYNYYIFNFTEDGVVSNKITAFDGLSANGFYSELSKSNLTVPVKKSEYHLGNLCIMNDYVTVTTDLTEIFSTPLKLKKLKPGSESAQVIIYYTHTSEAYCKNEEERYDLEGYSVTNDIENNVVASGTSIQKQLEKAGISVINDHTVHDSGKVDSIKYGLSAETLKKHLSENKDAVLAMDIHRDGVAPYKGAKWGPTKTDADGNKYSQIMLVVGMDYEDGTYRQGTDVNPYWKENLKLAVLLVEKLEERVPGITRGISFRRNPYNQQYATNSLLCEVGFDGNLTEDATRTADLLGQILAEVYS